MLSLLAGVEITVPVPGAETPKAGAYGTRHGRCRGDLAYSAGKPVAVLAWPPANHAVDHGSRGELLSS